MLDPQSPLPDIEAEALKAGSSIQARDYLRQKLKDDTRSGAKRLLDKFEKRVLQDEKETRRLETLGFYERQARTQSYQRIAGVDEAGRGPLAGPVVAAAVIFPPGATLRGLNDSKKLTAEKREELFNPIKELAVSVGVGSASVAEIDQFNIYRAAQMAMERAIVSLAPGPDYLLTDAMPLPKLSSIPQKPLVHGDSLSISIAAASVIAKVTRDRLMDELHEKFPNYGFKEHKGYGTEVHLRALEEYGVCPEHRLTFGPVTENIAKRTPGGPFQFWSAKLSQAKDPKALHHTGLQIKRLASDQLSEEQLEALRDLFKEIRSQLK